MRRRRVEALANYQPRRWADGHGGCIYIYVCVLYIYIYTHIPTENSESWSGCVGVASNPSNTTGSLYIYISIYLYTYISVYSGLDIDIFSLLSFPKNTTRMPRIPFVLRHLDGSTLSSHSALSQSCLWSLPFCGKIESVLPWSP